MKYCQKLWQLLLFILMGLSAGAMGVLGAMFFRYPPSIQMVLQLFSGAAHVFPLCR